jgi:hypothetical protein
MEEMCLMICGIARSCGIQVVKDLDPKEYEQFLIERKEIEEQQKKELQEKKEAKCYELVDLFIFFLHTCRLLFNFTNVII